jgi:multiple sugar transport system permease protein
MRPSLRGVRQGAEPYLFLLPHFIFFALFVVAPLVYSLVLSFHSWGLLGEAEYIGLTNFVRTWNDARFWSAVKNTVVFSAVSVPVVIAVGLALALTLNLRFYGRSWLMVAFVAPTFFGSIGILTTWDRVLASFPSGLANYYLGKAGLIKTAVSWFSSAPMAWTSIIMITVWWIVGFSVLLYLGALQRIPPEQYESAMIDGAGPWTRFRCITLPWIRNVLFFDVARQVLLAFGLFDQVYILTAGGPAGSTRTMVYYLYMVGFQRMQFGRAAAVSWYLFLVTVIFGFVQLLLLAKSVRSTEVE